MFAKKYAFLLLKKLYGHTRKNDYAKKKAELNFDQRLSA